MWLRTSETSTYQVGSDHDYMYYVDCFYTYVVVHLVISLLKCMQ